MVLEEPRPDGHIHASLPCQPLANGESSIRSSAASPECFSPGARHARSRIMTAAVLASQVVASLVGAPIRLAGATRAEITRALAEIGVPERELRMRAGQLWHWIYHRGVREFGAMRNISRPLLDRLAARCTLARPEITS